MLGLRRYRLSPFFSDVFWTFIAQGCVLVLGILLFRLAAKAFGPDGFGEYMLTRRIVSVSQPLVLLGLGIALPRYISTVHGRDSARQASYVAAAGLSVIVFNILALLSLNISPSLFGKLFFGHVNYHSFIRPLSVMVFGATANALVYSYYRGRMLMKMANLLQIIGVGILPLLFILTVPNCTVKLLIMLTGLGLCLTTLLFSLPLFKEIVSHKGYRQIGTSLKELLGYGLPRVPGGLALFGLLVLAPVIAAHLASARNSSMREVGYLSASISMVILISSGIVRPLDIVLLPKVSLLLSQGKKTMLTKNLNHLVAAVLHISIFTTIQLIIFTTVIIRLWLGEEYLGGCTTIRAVLMSIPFYLLYTALRSSVDAASVKAINARNICVALITFLITSFVMLSLRHEGNATTSLAMALTAGITVLGILTCLSAWKIYSLALVPYNLFVSILLAGIFGVVGILFEPFVEPGLLAFTKLVVIELCLFAIYLLLLRTCKVAWTEELLCKMKKTV